MSTLNRPAGLRACAAVDGFISNRGLDDLIKEQLIGLIEVRAKARRAFTRESRTRACHLRHLITGGVSKVW